MSFSPPFCDSTTTPFLLISSLTATCCYSALLLAAFLCFKTLGKTHSLPMFHFLLPFYFYLFNSIFSFLLAHVSKFFFSFFLPPSIQIFDPSTSSNTTSPFLPSITRFHFIWSLKTFWKHLSDTRFRFSISLQTVLQLPRRLIPCFLLSLPHPYSCSCFQNLENFAPRTVILNKCSALTSPDFSYPFTTLQKEH